MKKRLLCERLPTPSIPILLTPEETHHALHVCRLNDGDPVEAIASNGESSTAILRTQTPVRLEYNPHSKTLLKSVPSLPITLSLSILKNSSMSWVIEKAVELGLQEIQPLITQHTVVNLKKKGSSHFQTRWQKIADQALKQCGRTNRLEVKQPINLLQLFHNRSSQMIYLWCDEQIEQAQPLGGWVKNQRDFSNITHNHQSINILVGPEGGWSQEERNWILKQSETCTIQKIQLSPWTLRAETAALVCLSVLSIEYLVGFQNLQSNSSITPSAF